MKNYLVFDIGGTAIKYALVSEDAEILEKGSVPSPKRDASREEFFDLLDTLQKPYAGKYAGIAVSAPGIIDSVNGVIRVIGAFHCLRMCNVKEILEERFGVPASVENDGKSAALAEYWKGSLKGHENGAVVVIGTAVGGGLILDGKLRRGNDFFAGEFSCMCTNINEPDISKSYWSELGTYGLLRRIAARTGEDVASLSGKEAFRRINEGDPDALSALKEYTDRLAMQIFSVNILLDLDLFCIGGGISVQPKLIESLRQSISEIPSYNPDFRAGTILPLPKVEVCRFGNDANLIGALYHLLYENA